MVNCKMENYKCKYIWMTCSLEIFIFQRINQFDSYFDNLVIFIKSSTHHFHQNIVWIY